MVATLTAQIFVSALVTALSLRQPIIWSDQIYKKLRHVDVGWWLSHFVWCRGQKLKFTYLDFCLTFFARGHFASNMLLCELWITNKGMCSRCSNWVKWLRFLNLWLQPNCQLSALSHLLMAASEEILCAVKKLENIWNLESKLFQKKLEKSGREKFLVKNLAVLEPMGLQYVAKFPVVERAT